MNRRTYIKSLFSFGVVSASTYAVYRYIETGNSIKEGLLIQDMELLDSVAETILPETDVPGARKAGVGAYVAMIIRECTPPKLQRRFIDGLTEVNEYAYRKYNSTFVTCDENARIAILAYFENRSSFSIHLLNRIRNKFFGEPFIIQMKKLVVEGYCTSQLGATQGLAYDYIPVQYLACIALEPNQRTWAIK